MDKYIGSKDMFDFSDYYDKAAKQLPNNCKIVEVGTGDGASGLYLAQQLHSLGKSFKLYLVDNMDYGKYSQMKVIYQNVIASGLAEFIEVIPFDSLEASEMFNGDSLDMVFIDSSHEYKSTKKEIKKWYPLLKDGGIFSGHDATSQENAGVGKAVIELLPGIIKRPNIENGEHFQEFLPHQFLFIYETVQKNGVWEVIKNFYFTP